ncbi:MAG TPA: serine/threonine-protein kinase [Kofleriaceae bacterium]|jgi:serine/threonine-protein kinase|nr:serine/threonine-protein kinase [Kofleriaceae bacterium]
MVAVIDKSGPTEWTNSGFSVGDLISAYRIEHVIGCGGMGWVYGARHVLSEREVALKVLRVEQLQYERARDRMMREAAILASLSHPGIPRFYECGLLEDSRPWIAMELVTGTPLTTRLSRGVLPAHEVRSFVAATALVLAAGHERGVTHRDLKPDNIFLTPDDDTFHVRVVDWGIAHHTLGARYTNHNEAIGTPTYMAPEQARGGPTGGHCDVYALGVVAYHALTGKPPFIGANALEILVQHLNKPIPALAPRAPDAPWGLVELVERMLVKQHAHRPTAAEIHATLSSQVERPRVYCMLDDATPPTSDERPTTQMRALARQR